MIPSTSKGKVVKFVPVLLLALLVIDAFFPSLMSLALLEFPWQREPVSADSSGGSD
jgi:hypothetical protein